MTQNLSSWFWMTSLIWYCFAKRLMESTFSNLLPFSALFRQSAPYTMTPNHEHLFACKIHLYNTFICYSVELTLVGNFNNSTQIDVTWPELESSDQVWSQIDTLFRGSSTDIGRTGKIRIDGITISTSDWILAKTSFCGEWNLTPTPQTNLKC